MSLNKEEDQNFISMMSYLLIQKRENLTLLLKQILNMSKFLNVIVKQISDREDKVIFHTFLKILTHLNI